LRARVRAPRSEDLTRESACLAGYQPRVRGRRLSQAGERSGVEEDWAWLVFEVESILHLLCARCPEEEARVDYRGCVAGKDSRELECSALPRHSRVARERFSSRPPHGEAPLFISTLIGEARTHSRGRIQRSFHAHELSSNSARAILADGQFRTRCRELHELLLEYSFTIADSARARERERERERERRGWDPRRRKVSGDSRRGKNADTGLIGALARARMIACRCP